MSMFSMLLPLLGGGGVGGVGVGGSGGGGIVHGHGHVHGLAWPVVASILLLMLVPAGSYFILHARLLARYAQVENDALLLAREVGKLKREVASWKSAKDDFKAAADNLRLGMAYLGAAPLPASARHNRKLKQQQTTTGSSWHGSPEDARES